MPDATEIAAEWRHDLDEYQITDMEIAALAGRAVAAAEERPHATHAAVEAVKIVMGRRIPLLEKELEQLIVDHDDMPAVVAPDVIPVTRVRS